MTRKRRRLWIVLACGLSLGVAATLSLLALSPGMELFVLPADLAQRTPTPGRVFRLGGLVQAGSVQKTLIGREPAVSFRVTDGKASIPVTYVGILPDLFREGQGVVTLGEVQPDGSFRASEVLTKHDETYMPKDVAEALKRNGLWNPAAGPPPPASTWNTLNARQLDTKQTGQTGKAGG